MHTYIDTLLYTYRYACIYRVYFNQPRPDTTLSPGPDWAALGRTTKQLQIVFSLPPPTDPYPLPAPLPVSAPFMLAFIYLLAAAPVLVAFSIFRLQIGKVQTQNTEHVAESSIEMATGRSQSPPFEGGLSSRHRRQADRGRGEECMQPICSICSSSKATDKSNNK